MTVHMRLLLGLLVFGTIASAQIIFDTDSGAFADDGAALTMLLRSPRRKDVQGITVVSGNVWARSGAGYMSRNVRLLGLPKLPVLIGTEEPLVHTVAMVAKEKPLETDGAFSQPLPTEHPPHGGIDYIIRSIDAAPGKITILAIGPLTNIAVALRMRPDIARKIAGIVIMGGNVHVPGNASKAAEFNFWFDPEAAQVVLRSEIPNKVLFALDVCNNTQFTRQIFDKVVAVKTPITALYREEFGNGYPGFLKNPNVQGYLWDELAATYLIDPSMTTTTETLFLDVDSTFGASYGAVKPLDRDLAPAATPVRVVLNMEFPRVYDLYIKALTAQ